MHTNGMAVIGTEDFFEDLSGQEVDKACNVISDAAQLVPYEAAGSSAVRTQHLSASRIRGVIQGVVLFPTARDAGAFYVTSTEQWAACSNRQFTVQMGGGTPDQVWTVGPVSNVNGILSVIRTRPAVDFGGGASWSWESCQRALTAANNVIVDINACTIIQSDTIEGAAVSVAQQIAAKVPGA